jgi:multiple sugar transport system permease protein
MGKIPGLFKKLSAVARHSLILIYLAYLVFPMIWIISTSLKPTSEIYSGKLALIPEAISLTHYVHIFEQGRLLPSILNSLITGVFSTLLVILIAVPAAYALTRFRSALNRVMLGWILTTQIFPAILVIIPLYIVLRLLHLTDSLSGLSLILMIYNLPFVLWMLHGYFKNVPVELEEAAAIDGANRVQIVYRILMPVLLPAIAASMIFAFISAWNEFFFALILIKSPDLMTLPVELASFTGIEGQAQTGPLAAACFLATIPSLVMFVITRRWFSSSLMSGALKD